MEIFGIFSSVATVGALIAALWQLRRGVKDARARDEDKRVERTLEMYEDVVSQGATYESFHRLSLFLREVGSKKYGGITWRVLGDEDLADGGLLDPFQKERGQYYADLYAVMWFFERARISLERGLVSKDMLMESLGFHFWWWGQILRDVRGPKASIAVHDLARSAQEWAVSKNLFDDWKSRCVSDFNGGSGEPG